MPSPPAIVASLLVFCATAAAAEGVVNPYPRRLVRLERLATWDFEKGTEGWQALHDCSIEAVGGALRIVSRGRDPYLQSPALRVRGEVVVRLRVRSRGRGGGQVFYATEAEPAYAEGRSVRFRLVHDGQWHTIEVPIRTGATITRIRLDPGTAPGTIELDSVEIVRQTYHPLEITRVVVQGRKVVASVKSHARRRLEVAVNGSRAKLGPGETRQFELRAKADKPFETLVVEASTPGFPPATRPVFLHHPEIEAEWLTLSGDKLAVQVAPDGSGARVLLGGRLVAIIAPLAHRDGHIPATKASRRPGRPAVELTGGGVHVVLELAGNELHISIASDRVVEGPVVRVLGGLEQGLFAGLEYLGKGERSSSTADIETPEHIRYAPDPMKVTMPLMAFVTDRCSAALLWRDMALQPVFATPNFFEGTPDHRMALRGKRIEAALAVAPSQPIEESILWAVRKRGLPPPPKPPRTVGEQWRLCLGAFDGPLKGPGGWGHCAEPRWPRHPYADFASVIWRIRGRAPELPRLVPGGAHIRNDAIYFVTGRAREWLRLRRQQVIAILRGQKPDGSFRYSGKYRRGHFEDTASGYCARPAMALLEFAWLTGDKAALAAGLRTLEFMKRFRTPRGAQTWELSLHTPDILASAYLAWAYLRGYQLTGNADYLAQARRWALSGIPFVYQWANRPVMLYATIPVYGATNWRAPNWMGLPVQWCGTVYAYALGLLAPHEKTLDWARLARGILVCAEQQQYPDGPLAGTLPDSFALASQQRRGPNINPAALVSLRMLLDGQLPGLAVATDGEHRVVSPFPVEVRDGEAIIRAKKGVRYQVLVDGSRVLDIQSQGTDTIPLD